MIYYSPLEFKLSLAFRIQISKLKRSKHYNLDFASIPRPRTLIITHVSKIKSEKCKMKCHLLSEKWNITCHFSLIRKENESC